MLASASPLAAIARAAPVDSFLASSDFKNGIYRLNSAYTTLAALWVENLTYGAFDPASVVAGSGFAGGNNWPVSSAALLAALDPTGRGFTAVMDATVSTLGAADQVYADMLLGPIDYSAEWHAKSQFFDDAHATDSRVVLGDFDTAETNSNAALNNVGLKRIAASFSTAGMFVSVNGSAVYDRTTGQLGAPASDWHVILQGGTGAGAGVSHIEKVVFYTLQPSARLPQLST